jgi:peroxiredoxin Q/BCP
MSSELKVGDKAPSFSVKDQHGNEVTLKSFSGKKIVLYFYPKDMTPGCTVQAKNLNENLANLRSKGFEVYGVSADSQERHCKFIDKYGLEFPLIADESKELIQAFGVWGKKKFMGREYEGIHRKTFIINEEGVISRIIEKVKTKAHAEQVLEETN